MGNAHLCLETEDIEVDYARLRDHAQFRSAEPVEIPWGPYKGGRVCYLRDPDGISVEPCSRPAGPTWRIDMSLRLACADSTFPKLSHEASLTVIKDLGFTAADVVLFHRLPAHAAGYRPRGSRCGRRRGEIARLERLELAVSDVFMIVGGSFEEFAINHPDRAVRDESLEQFRSFVAFAGRLRAPGLTILPGATFEDAGEDASLELAATELNRRAEIAGEAVAAAPSSRTTGLGGGDAGARARARGANARRGLRARLQPLRLPGESRSRRSIRGSRERTTSTRAEAAPGVIQARTHEGVIDFAGIRDALLGMGYDGYFAVEYQWEDGWLDFSRVDCIAETADTRAVLLDGTAVGNGGSA